MKNDYQFPFEKLRVWQESRVWIGYIYKITCKFPKTEAFGLTSQLNRAAANLAEGSARTHDRQGSGPLLQLIVLLSYGIGLFVPAGLRSRLPVCRGNGSTASGNIKVGQPN